MLWVVVEWELEVGATRVVVEVASMLPVLRGFFEFISSGMTALPLGLEVLGSGLELPRIVFDVLALHADVRAAVPIEQMEMAAGAGGRAA